jgi:uncharacterized protein YndB with AHSA1/START domain
MTHPFEIHEEINVDATPDEVWQAITSGPGVDSWLMGHSDIDGASKTATFSMFGHVSTSSITAWEPGHRYATQEDKNPDGTFAAFEWLIDRGTAAAPWCALCTAASSATTGRPSTTACPSAITPT